MAERRSIVARALLCACLACGGVPIVPASAMAQTSDEVRAQANQEYAHLEELAQQMQSTREELDEFERQIDELAQKSVEVQGQLIEDRVSLADMVDTTYRWGSPSLMDIALSSKTIEEFVSNLYYAKRVTEWQTSCVEDLRADKERLQHNMDEIERAREERQQVADELDVAYEQTQATVDSLMARAATLEKEEREAEERRIAEAARVAEQERARKEAEQSKAEAERVAREEAPAQIEAARKMAQDAEDASAPQQESTEPEASEVAPEAEPAADAEPAVESEPAAEAVSHVEVPDQDVPLSDEGDWITCIASAYAIADNDPPGSTATASGIPLDESVPTVALPMSMGPSSFYGKQIQIEYQGITVIATITDCGDLDGGNRGLDLTPAVFRAFGASTCDEWGLRTVRYRFL